MNYATQEEYTVPYKTTSVFGFCFPPSTSDLPPKAKTGYKLLKESLRHSAAGTAIEQIVKAGSSIGISIVTAFIFSCILLALMAAYAQTIAWICIILTMAGLFGGSVACFFMRSDVIA